MIKNIIISKLQKTLIFDVKNEKINCEHFVCHFGLWLICQINWSLNSETLKC